MAATNQWTPPQSWNGGDIAKAAKFNLQVRDNMTWLKSRPFATTATGTVTTTSTSFVEMTNSSQSLTTVGGYILFWACGRTFGSIDNTIMTFDLAVDGIRQGHTTFGTTIVETPIANYNDNLNLMMITGGGAGGSLLAAGAHTCSIYWKVASGTATAVLNLYMMEIC